MSNDLEAQLLDNIDKLFATARHELTEEEATLVLSLTEHVSVSEVLEVLATNPNVVVRNLSTSAWLYLSERVYNGYGKAKQLLEEYSQWKAEQYYDPARRLRRGATEELRLARNAYNEPVESIFGAVTVAIYGLEYIVRHYLPKQGEAMRLVDSMRDYKSHIAFLEQLHKDQNRRGQ
jgi:hypothetical protein